MSHIPNNPGQDNICHSGPPGGSIREQKEQVSIVGTGFVVTESAGVLVAVGDGIGLSESPHRLVGKGNLLG